MPTVWRIGTHRVVIYPNDHRPAHVHVVGVAVRRCSSCIARTARLSFAKATGSAVPPLIV